MSLSHPVPEREKLKKFFILSSRELNADEYSTLEYHGSVTKLQKVHSLCTIDELQGDFIIVNVGDSWARRFVEINRVNILKHNYCFLRSFHERSVPDWVRDILNKSEDIQSICSVIKEIEFIKDTQQFLDYLLNFHKVSKPDTLLKWAWVKVSRIFRWLVCNGQGVYQRPASKCVGLVILVASYFVCTINWISHFERKCASRVEKCNSFYFI